MQSHRHTQCLCGERCVGARQRANDVLLRYTDKQEIVALSRTDYIGAVLDFRGRLFMLAKALALVNVAQFVTDRLLVTEIS